MKNYLVYANSYKLAQEQVSKLLLSSNVIKYDMRTDNLLSVINEANYFSLTGDIKYIVVRADSLFKSKKNDEDVHDENEKLLENYLKNPSESSQIIFVCLESPDKRRKMYKLMEKYGQIIGVAALNKKELTYKCMDLLKMNNYVVSYEVANYIVENSYLNYDIMTSELDKIYSLIKSKYLTIENIEDVISKSITNTSFAYITAVVNKDFKGAVNASKNFSVLKIDPAMILVMLAKEFEIYYLLLDGNNPKEIQNLMKKENWQMNNYLETKNHLDLKQIKKIIIKLCDYDYKYKSGQIDKDILMDLLTFDLC